MDNKFVSCSRILRSAPRITEAMIERRPDLLMLGLDLLGTLGITISECIYRGRMTSPPGGKGVCGCGKRVHTGCRDLNKL